MERLPRPGLALPLDSTIARLVQPSLYCSGLFCDVRVCLRHQLRSRRDLLSALWPRLHISLTWLQSSDTFMQQYLLHDGSIIDSAMLPQGSIREAPISMEPESIYQAMRSGASSLLTSGGSNLDTPPSRDSQARRSTRKQGTIFSTGGSSLMETAHSSTPVRTESEQFFNPSSQDTFHSNVDLSARTSPEMSSIASQSLTLTQAPQNLAASQQNLSSFLSQAGGETLEYRPVTVFNSTATSSQAQPVPGRNLLMPYAIAKLYCSNHQNHLIVTGCP